MEIKLKHKYMVYNGDTDMGKRAQTQYSTARGGGGNGKRAVKANVTEEFRKAGAALSKGHAVKPKVMHVNGLTGHRVMVDA